MATYLSLRVCSKVCTLHLNQFVRYRTKLVINYTPTNINRALRYFDDFYRPYFGAKWPSIRLGLLCPPRVCAVLNNFSYTEQIEDELTNIGAVELGKLYEEEQTKSSSNNVDTEDENTKKNKRPIERMFGDFLKDHEMSMTKRPSEETSDLEENLLSGKTDRTACTDESEIRSDLNEFQPISRLKGIEDFIDETDHIKHLNETAEMPFQMIKPTDLPFYQLLKVMVFPNDNVSPFPQPKRDVGNLLSYYLMDAAAILPVLLLQPHPEDDILDLCAAPGGKALTIIQTMMYSTMVCNGFRSLKTLQDVFRNYIPNEQSERIKFTNLNAEHWEEQNVYSKVLVDVPCTNDRLSVSVDDTNIFSHKRLRERILLPESQIKMLYSALLAVKTNGTVVYCTRSLSPAQNDGAVNMALLQVLQNTSAEFVIHDLSDVMKTWNFLFRFQNTKYGQLVLPYLPLNNGPMYVCKLIRIK